MESAHAFNPVPSMYMCVRVWCAYGIKDRSPSVTISRVSHVCQALTQENLSRRRCDLTTSSPTLHTKLAGSVHGKKTWRTRILGFALCEGGPGPGWFHLRPDQRKRELPNVNSPQLLSLGTENKLLTPWDHNLYFILPRRHSHFLLTMRFDPWGTRVFLFWTGIWCSLKCLTPGPCEAVWTCSRGPQSPALSKSMLWTFCSRQGQRHW